MVTAARALPRVFSRRMLPIALGVALSVAMIPPSVYSVAARRQLASRAELSAGYAASAVGQLAMQQPYLWRYNASKVLAAAAPAGTQSRLAWLRIADCTGRTLQGPLQTSTLSSGPLAWAEIRAAGRAVGFVEVALDGTPEHETGARLALACGALGSLLGAGVFLFPRSVVRRQSVALGRAEAELTDANRSLSASVEAAVGQVRDLSARINNIQEAERERIARDLHDGVGQSLTALRQNLDLAMTDLPRRAPALDSAVVACEEALRELKGAVHDLRPPELSHGLLAEALRACAERFELRSQVNVSFRASGADVRSLALTTCLLRVLQEALTNVGRHARASEVGVRLTVGEGLAVLEVEDDGRGFSVLAVPADRMGLRGMRERCTLEGGGADIQSQPDQGTQVRAWVPLKGRD